MRFDRILIALSMFNRAFIGVTVFGDYDDAMQGLSKKLRPGRSGRGNNSGRFALDG